MKELQLASKGSDQVIRRGPKKAKQLSFFKAPKPIFEAMTEELQLKTKSYEQLSAWVDELAIEHGENYKATPAIIRAYHGWVMQNAQESRYIKTVVETYRELNKDSSAESNIIDVMMHELQVALGNMEKVTIRPIMTVREVDTVVRLALRVEKVRADIVGMKKRLGIEVANIGERIKAFTAAGKLDAVIADSILGAVIGIPNAIGIEPDNREEDRDE